MASLGELFVKIKGDTTGFNKSVKSIKTEVAGLGGSLSKIAGGFAIGTVVASGITAIVSGFKSAIGSGIEFNKVIESNLTSFEVLTGSMEKAEMLMKSIKDFAIATPFEIGDLSKNASLLLGYGVSLNNIMPSLQMLGDLSQGNTERFNSLALAFGQVAAKGKLMGQEMLQMVNQGFNPLQVLSKSTGKSVAQLTDEMSKGLISVNDLAKAMQDATSEGGQFFGMMSKQSRTFAGQMSTLRDNVKQLLGTAFEPLFNFLKDKLLPKLNEFATNVLPAMQRFAQGTTIAFNVIGQSLSTLSNSFSKFGNLLSTFKDINENVSSQTIGFWTTWGISITSLIAGTINYVAKSLDSLVKLGMAAKDLTTMLTKTDMNSKLEAVRRIYENPLADSEKIIKDTNEEFKNSYQDALKSMKENLKGFLTESFDTNLFTEILDSYDSAVAQIKKSQKETSNTINQFNDTKIKWEDIIYSPESGKTIADSVTDAMQNIADTIKQKARGIMDFNDIFGIQKMDRLSFKDLRYRMQEQLKIMMTFKSSLEKIGEQFGKDSAIYEATLLAGPKSAGQALALSQMPKELANEFAQQFKEKADIAVGLAGEQQRFETMGQQITQNINVTIPQSNDPQFIINEVVRRLRVVGAY